jgi:zinc transporter ZupT
MRALLAAAEQTPAQPASQLLGGISAVGMAFLLVVIAGLCAPLGACVVLFINTEKHVQMLPGGLALAAGVMILVSFYEVR